jgi:hypothetical protein
MSLGSRFGVTRKKQSSPTYLLEYGQRTKGAGPVMPPLCVSLRQRLTATKEQLTLALNAGLGAVMKTLLDLPDYPFMAIGVDPGGTTGVAVYLITEDNPPLLFETFQWGEPNEVWIKLEELAVKYEDENHHPVVFIVEQFDKRPGVADPDFTSKFIINDIDRYLGHRTVVYQIVSAAKNLVKPATKGRPDGLKRFGYYQVNMGHANDASRHVIMFLVETLKHRPTILKGWPK